MKTGWIFIFTLFTLPSFAGMCPCESGSGEKKTRLELGINGFRFSEKLFNFYSSHPVYETVIPAGMMLKYHFDRFSVRAGADLIRESYTFEHVYKPYYDLNRGKSRTFEFRAGAEKTMSSVKLRWYIGMDLVYASASYEGRTEGYGDLTGPYVWDYRFFSRSGGISPLAGINYRPHKHFSVSLEASVILFGYKTKRSYGPFMSESGTGLMFNPARLLSLNYHFAAR